MNKRRIILGFLLSGTILLNGCTAVPNRPPETISAPQTEETQETERYDEIETKHYPVNKHEAAYKLNAEGGVFEGSVRSDGDYFDGQGYVVLDKGMTLTHIVEPEHEQHYRFVLAVQSYEGAVIKLDVARETVGCYYVPATKTPDFQLLAIDCVYLSCAPTVLAFTCESGSAALDYILVENSDEVSASCYRTGTAAVSPNSSISAIGAVKYLTEGYGKRVLTAQNVTPATNAELETIYAETGRYPAIRCGEMALVTDEESRERSDTELELGLEWGRNGGLVSYTWHWYSPDVGKTVYAEETGFSLSDAMVGADIQQVALADSDELKTLRENGMASAALCDLVADMDKAAQALKAFRDEDIPVIWQPIPEGDSSLYWWGGDAESYKALWDLMFTRFSEFHSLGNLIWVWNGSSADFRPFDKQFDILGQTFSEGSSASFAGRFSALAQMSEGAVKPQAITSCDRLPKPEYLLRDNALWLWTAIGSGDVIINADGTLSERMTDWQTLHDAYNSILCVTLDELPDFAEYAVGE